MNSVQLANGVFTAPPVKTTIKTEKSKTQLKKERYVARKEAKCKKELAKMRRRDYIKPPPPKPDAFRATRARRSRRKKLKAALAGKLVEDIAADESESMEDAWHTTIEFPAEIWQMIFFFTNQRTVFKARMLNKAWNLGWEHLFTARYMGPMWKRLDLRPFKKPKCITKEAIVTILKAVGKFVQILDITHHTLHNSVLDTTTFRTIVKECPQLEYLNLASNYSLHDRHFTMTRCSLEPEKALVNENVRRLNLNQSIHITQRTISHIGFIFPNIRHLNISQCKRIRCKALEQIPTRMPNLQSLSLKHLVASGDHSFINMMTNLKNLEELDISFTWLSKWGMNAVGTQLELESEDRKTWEKAVAEWKPGMAVPMPPEQRVAKLKVLKINSNKGMCDEGLAHLLKFEHLEVLEMMFMPLRVTPAAVESVREGLALKSLKSLKYCMADASEPTLWELPA
ncbi:hypothetical protein HK104_005305 [Borealophlyctis nickersoniae]|nr:hypothetical protein HK104_005305 [Borealophlyctis nickersoniae]